MATVMNPQFDVEVEECLIMKVEKDSEWASEPILERSGSTECESFRKCFRQFCYEDVTGPQEAFSKLWELCCRWLRPEMRSKEQILEQLVIEQFLTILPEKIQAWAQKQCPESGEEAVALVVHLEKETRRLRKQVSEDFKVMWWERQVGRATFLEELIIEINGTLNRFTNRIPLKGDLNFIPNGEVNFG